MDYRISAYAAADYSDERMDAAVAAHFAAFGISKLIEPESRIVLKPNLLMRRKPSAGTTTHPALVAAVVRELRRLGAKNITIADSPGGPYNKTLLESVYRGCGMHEAAEFGAILNLDTGYSQAEAPQAELCRLFEIISPVREADIVINLPKLKTHALTGLSGAVKNLLGCVPGLQKPELHLRFKDKSQFSRMLVELAQLVNPTFTIVDAVVSMEGEGPSSGTLRQTNMTFAAQNPFALDLALCEFAGIPARLIPTVTCSQELELCPRDAFELEYLGEKPLPVPDFILPALKNPNFAEKVPAPFRGIYLAVSAGFEPRPQIKRDMCIGCGRCAEICAAMAITIEDKKAQIDREKCFRCFCCHEMCPIKAIGIKKSSLFRH